MRSLLYGRAINRIGYLLITLSLINCSAQTQLASSAESASLADLYSVQWIHGSPNCETASSDPDYLEWQQVHYQQNTYIFRQNKCSNYEGPFVYLFIGSGRALLIDTGATVAGGPLLLEQIRAITDLPLVVAHTHGHGDHRQGDGAFQNHEDISLVAVGAEAVQAYFGFVNWPSEPALVDLGDRRIEILPIPGHSNDDLAFYDPQTQIVITGDTLYPGRLYVRNWPEYRSSIRRLANWTEQKPVSMVLGTHIEMSSSPNIDYPIRTTYQPDEHQLPLSVDDILTLRDALEESDSPERIPLGSFIVWPI